MKNIKYGEAGKCAAIGINSMKIKYEINFSRFSPSRHNAENHDFIMIVKFEINLIS